MKERLRINTTIARLSALMLMTGTVLLPLWSGAQSSTAQDTKTDTAEKQARGDRKERQDKEKSRTQNDADRQESGKEKKAGPSNPLALPEKTEEEPSFQTNDRKNVPDFHDYRQSMTDSGSGKTAKVLDLFGYEFFQPAREIIELHRAWLKQRYGTSKTLPEKRAVKPGRESGMPPVPENHEGVGEKEGREESHPSSENPGRSAVSNETRGAAGSANGENARQEPVNAYEEVADPLSQLYRNVTASIPPNYQLAPGDSITVRYGSPKHELRAFTAAIDSQGSVALPEMGVVVLRGLTVTQAEKALQAQMRRYYNGIETSITLGKLRTIQVTVSGLSFQPGSYSVPSVATAYNVLYASGGPSEAGTLRAIEVRRQGKLVATLDMYKYWLTGTQADVPLQDGDLLYIAPRRSRIGVSGEVLHPAAFELAAGETLNDALGYAGGVKASGVDQRVQINTLVPGTERILKDIDLKSQSAASLPLYDGDVVDVFSVRPLLANRVTIEGAVDQPSDYALMPDMKVSELLLRARGTLSDAFLTRADLYRWNADNTTTLIPINLDKALAHDPAHDIPLVRWDRLKIYTRQEVAWTGKRTITVRGAVSRPGLYSRSNAMHVADLLLLAGGPAPNAFLDRAVLLHQNGDSTFDIEYVNLGGLTAGDTKDKGPLVKDNDILAVYKVGEAQFEPEHTVTIRGEIVAPGPYPRSEGMRLSDLLKLSGGFKPGAGAKVVVAHARKAVGANNGALHTVTVLFDEHRYCAPQDDARLEDGDVVMVQGTGGFVEKVQTITVRGAVNNPGPMVLSNKNMKLSDALREAGGLRAESFPEGAELVRDNKMLATARQKTLTDSIGQLNDLLNEHTYERERGKSYIERLKAAGSASQSEGLSLPGSAPANTANPVTAQIAGKLAQEELVSPARKLSSEQLTPGGDIAINLPEALRKPGSIEDLLLTDGDVITIPEKPTTVQVVGAVVHGSGVAFRPGSSLDFYITQVGGYAPDAAKDRIVVIHVGGGLLPANKVKQIVPGDIIVVPTRVLAEKLANHSNGIGEIFKSITNSAILFKLAGSLFGL